MAAASSRRGAFIGLGVVLLLAGLIAAVVLWNVASQRIDNAIQGFARAPVGCDTTLDFVETGEYLVFLETRGVIDGVRGDCDIDGSFDEAGSSRPDVSIQILDPDEQELDLDRVIDDVEYSTSDFEGSTIFSVDVEQRNDHVIRVESDDDDTFAVAIGRDPNDGVAALRMGAIAAGLAGLVLGGLFILLGARKTQATVAAGAWTPGTPQYQPGGPAPQGPPVYGQPGQVGAPQYQQPPIQQPQYQQPPVQQPQYQQPQQPAPPQYPQQPGYQQPQQPPAAPQYPPQREYQQPAPPPPPFAPTAPQAPIDPAGSPQPIDWAPSADRTVEGLDTAPPDADFIARLQAERDAGDQPPPPQ